MSAPQPPPLPRQRNAVPVWGYLFLSIGVLVAALVAGPLLFQALETGALTFTTLGVDDPVTAWWLMGVVLGGLLGGIVGLHQAGRRRQLPEFAGALGLLALLALVGAGTADRYRPLLPDPPAGLFSAVVEADNLNVREGASPDAARVALVERGTTLTVIDSVGTEPGVWYHVRLDGGTEGWINADYVRRETLSAAYSAEGMPDPTEEYVPVPFDTMRTPMGSTQASSARSQDRETAPRETAPRSEGASLGGGGTLGSGGRPPEEPTDRVFEVVEQMPELIGGLASIRPEYPDLERRAGVGGRVFLQFVVNEDGSVSDVTVSRGVSPGLDRAAVAAVQRARFTPGRQRGQPVRVRYSLPVNFRLSDAPPPAEPTSAPRTTAPPPRTASPPPRTSSPTPPPPTASRPPPPAPSAPTRAFTPAEASSGAFSLRVSEVTLQDVGGTVRVTLRCTEYAEGYDGAWTRLNRLRQPIQLAVNSQTYNAETPEGWSTATVQGNGSRDGTLSFAVRGSAALLHGRPAQLTFPLGDERSSAIRVSFTIP